jgi:hypothetical protein
MKFMGGGKRHPCDSDKRLAAIHIFINVGYIPLEYNTPTSAQRTKSRQRQATDLNKKQPRLATGIESLQE